MKKLSQILFCLSLCSINLFGQNFTNGDLEGFISGFSTLPSSWTAIDANDVNCEADFDATTPDLINPTEPGTTFNGMIGTPYSGSTFVGGSYGGTLNGSFFHEGIQQNISGFTIGENYVVSFYQSVVKTQYCADTSGTWMMIVDNTIAGIPEATVSQEEFSSITTNWEMRNVSFTASQDSHDIKFLPIDDDDNQVGIIGDQNGCIFMGIDSISIQLATQVGIVENDFGNELLLYPNPTKGNFSIDLGQNYKTTKITITDMLGKVVQSRTYSDNQLLALELKEPAGVHILQV